MSDAGAPSNARLAGIAGLAMLVVTALALGGVLAYDRSIGGELATWRIEYAGGGSGEFRSPEGSTLQTLLIATLWIHVTAPLSSLLLLAGIAADRRPVMRAVYAIAVVAAIALFVVILQQSLMRPAFGITPSGFPRPDGV